MSPLWSSIGDAMAPLGASLWRASLTGALAAVSVWAVCRWVPRLSAAVRCALWWGVGLKLLLDLCWLAPVALPVLPASAAPHVAGGHGERPAAMVDPSAASIQPVGSEMPRRAGVLQDVARLWPILSSAAGCLWLSGVVAGSVRAGRRHRRMRDVIAEAAPASVVFGVAEEIARQLGVRRVPDARISDAVDTPLVVGVTHPVILLPRSFTALGDAEQRMVICHELAHVRRADLLLGFVPALAERLFFFHPLARLAAREYSLWREAACDGLVLRTLGAAPQAYGLLLLSLGIARQSVSSGAAGAPWSVSILKRRILMLRNPSALLRSSRLTAAAVVGIAVLAVVPMRLTARPSVAAPAPQSAAGGSHTSASSTQPTASATVGHAAATVTGDQGLSYVLYVEQGRHNATMSGSSSDMDKASRLRRGGEPLLWFRLGSKEYVVRDAAVLREAEEIWRPVSRLGEQQGELGAQQGALGARQGELGRKQGEVGARQGELGARQGELGARQGQLASRAARQGLTEGQRDAFERDARALEQEMRELGRQMDQLGKEMDAHNGPMRELGDQMAALGRQMGELGRQMEEASAKAESTMRALVDRAIKSGAATEAR
jgi:bla regulator protein blaR1